MAIFEHEDSAGDAFKITGSPRVGELALYWAEDNASYVNLPRSVVRDLRDALNRWLDEQQRHDPNPAGSNTAPPYETLVRRLVAEEVARVLPLHQSPQAAMVPDPDAEHGWAKAPGFCTIEGCKLTVTTTDHLEHDPEPQAVGHPEAPGIDWTDKSGVRYEYCTECGHVWGAHSPSDVRHGCGAILGKGRCGCEAIRADQRPPVAPDSSRYDGEGEPVKAECTCRRHEHRPGATRRCAYPGCFCRRQS